MKKYLFAFNILLSLIYGRAISTDTVDSYVITTLTPSASSMPISLKIQNAEKDRLQALNRAKDFKQKYLQYFEDLEKGGKKINYALLSYILNQIKVRLPGDQGNPNLPLTENQLYLATSFLFMPPEEEANLTEENLLQVCNILENVVTTYTRYEATLWDPQNVASVKGIEWLNEGVLQMAAVELQKVQPGNPLNGIIDYDTLSITSLHDDIKRPGRIIEKTSAAFQYSTSNVVTFPLNLGRTHWIMIAIQQDGNVAVIDSYSADRTSITKQIVAALNDHGIYDHTGNLIKFKPYNKGKPTYTALQSDSYQCGVHSLVYCTAIAKAGSISGGLAIIHDSIAKGKKVTFEHILDDTFVEVPSVIQEALDGKALSDIQQALSQKIPPKVSQKVRPKVEKKIPEAVAKIFQSFRVQLQQIVKDLTRKTFN